MKNKLKYMRKKGNLEAFRLTENGCLEILSRDTKVVENYFLFDGKHYYFGNQLVKCSSSTWDQNDLILAMTETKLLVPQDNEDYLYIARNHAAAKDQLIVALYYCDKYIHYLFISGKGSGRVHRVYLPCGVEGYKFYFHSALEAIAAVDPKMAGTIYADITQKCKKAKAEISEEE